MNATTENTDQGQAALPTPSEKSLQLAAQLWQHPNLSNRETDTEFAHIIALQFDRYEKLLAGMVSIGDAANLPHALRSAAHEIRSLRATNGRMNDQLAIVRVFEAALAKSGGGHADCAGLDSAYYLDDLANCIARQVEAANEGRVERDQNSKAGAAGHVGQQIATADGGLR